MENSTPETKEQVAKLVEELSAAAPTGFMTGYSSIDEKGGFYRGQPTFLSHSGDDSRDAVVRFVFDFCRGHQLMPVAICSNIDPYPTSNPFSGPIAPIIIPDEGILNYSDMILMEIHSVEEMHDVLETILPLKEVEVILMTAPRDLTENLSAELTKLKNTLRQYPDKFFFITIPYYFTDTLASLREGKLVRFTLRSIREKAPKGCFLQVPWDQKAIIDIECIT